MGFPLPPNRPVPMVALVPDLPQQCWAGQMTPVPVGHAFWAAARDVPVLTAAGQARPWVAGSDPPLPPPEPRWTAHGTPGGAAGSSNSSH